MSLPFAKVTKKLPPSGGNSADPDQLNSQIDVNGREGSSPLASIIQLPVDDSGVWRIVDQAMHACNGRAPMQSVV
jgi:hypothetical protein